MKSILSIFAVLFLVSPAMALKVGDTAPAFSLENVDKKKKSLSEYTGKYVVLEWYNKDCPFVQKHYNHDDANKAFNMQSTQKELTSQGVVWLRMNSGKQGQVAAADAKKQAESEGASVSEILMDPTGATGKAYEAKTTPHMYVIDPKGKIIYMGAIDSIKSAEAEDLPKATNYVKAALTEAKAGKPVKTASTPAYGCSIKYN